MPRVEIDVVAVEAEAVGQLQPALDAAVAFALAVMIDEALAPFAAQRGIARRARSALASFIGIIA